MAWPSSTPALVSEDPLDESAPSDVLDVPSPLVPVDELELLESPPEVSPGLLEDDEVAASVVPWDPMEGPVVREPVDPSTSSGPVWD